MDTRLLDESGLSVTNFSGKSMVFCETQDPIESFYPLYAIQEIVDENL